MDIQKGATYPKGFRAAGAACGLKKNGGLDLALVAADGPCAAAGIFTRNVVKGHSLLLSQKNVAAGAARTVVVNSGCANACLGSGGNADALKMAELTAEAVGCAADEVLPGSTGVIGVRLDMDKLARGIAAAGKGLSIQGGEAAARAIMTTDTMVKQIGVAVNIAGREVRVGGMCKGSGMIHPDMATMIAVLTTDADISPAALDATLREAAAVSFNRVSVDGDTSVCDMAVVLASGLAGNPRIEAGAPECQLFAQALSKACHAMARMLAADGEGATKLLEIRANGLPSPAGALKAAQAVAKSPLVKAAAFGCDANWGRILTAAGYAGVPFDPDRVDVFIGAVQVCAGGRALPFDEAAALAELQKPEVLFRIEFNQGAYSDFMLACDLTYDYVKINGSYRT
jgi:glutamate N-acetyltransferase/amino-acid N-acetyltransferase